MFSERKMKACDNMNSPPRSPVEKHARLKPSTANTSWEQYVVLSISQSYKATHEEDNIAFHHQHVATNGSSYKASMWPVAIIGRLRGTMMPQSRRGALRGNPRRLSTCTQSIQKKKTVKFCSLQTAVMHIKRTTISLLGGQGSKTLFSKIGTRTLEIKYTVKPYEQTKPTFTNWKQCAR